MVNFSIGDLLIRIKNATALQSKSVEVPKFKFGLALLEVLKQTGFIVDYEILGKTISVTLQYEENGLPKIQDVRFYSKPGRRWYMKVDEITPVRSGTGILVLSTPKGVMTSIEARKQNLGGELICEIW